MSDTPAPQEGVTIDVVVPVEHLDRSRAFATVHGDETGQQSYAQRSLGISGWPYDHEGRLLVDMLTPEQADKLLKKKAEAAARVAANRSVPAEPAVIDDDEGDDVVERTKVDEVEATEDVNLELWLTGKARYKPFEIQQAIKARYGANKPNMKEAARFLVEEKHLVRWEDVTLVLRPSKNPE